MVKEMNFTAASREGGRGGRGGGRGGRGARGRPTAAPALGLLAFSLCVSGASGIYCVSSNKWLPASKQFKLINLR